jgi:hypothetical protein
LFFNQFVFFLLVITLISFIDDSCQNNTNSNKRITTIYTKA